MRSLTVESQQPQKHNSGSRGDGADNPERDCAALRPGNGGVWTGLGQALARQGRRHPLVEQLRQALQLPVAAR